jgi:hypothetical protein
MIDHVEYDKQCVFVENGTLFDFGIFSSKMFSAWADRNGEMLGGVATQISVTFVYNSFCLPFLIEAERIDIANKAEEAIESKNYEGLDKAVDSIYGLINPTDEERIEILYKLYKEKICQN